MTLHAAGIPDIPDRQRFLACARGEVPCDLVLKNGRIINVFTREIMSVDVGISQGFIAGIGRYRGKQELDVKSGYICPGFIDGHIHLESSLLTPQHFAEAALPHGTTAVVCDPHEIANVLGTPGIGLLLDSAEHTVMDIFVMAPSCVPATPLETSGATLNSAEIRKILRRPGVAGLAEMMNFPGAVHGDPDVLAKLAAARENGMPVDGHAPGLTGKFLQAYCAAGISSDHECTTLDEAREKLRAGMYIFIREGSTARNLAALLPLVTPETAHRFLLVSDDLHADDLLEQGHLDRILRKAVSLGMDPLSGLQMVTINPSLRFGLDFRGAVAPGYLADLTVVGDLRDFSVHQVFKQGKLTAQEGVTIPSGTSQPTFSWPSSPLRVSADAIDFTIPAQSGKIRVIGCMDGEIVTRHLVMDATIKNGKAIADPARDLAKIAVIERHRGSGAMAIGFVHGLGLREGALASTVAHDSHNLIVTGTDDVLMRRATDLLVQKGGGLAIVTKTEDSVLPLPVAGLMSTASAADVAAGLRSLAARLKAMGLRMTNPFMLLSFLALPVIPELKITDQGLVDVTGSRTVELWLAEEM